MDRMKPIYEERWHRLEVAKRHTRKVACTLMGLALTSLFVAIAAPAG